MFSNNLHLKSLSGETWGGGKKFTKLIAKITVTKNEPTARNVHLLNVLKWQYNQPSQQELTASLQREDPPNKGPGYETKPADGEAPVLDFRGM